MINQLTLQNYKCFVKSTIPFANLTLLVGANASGKSSIIQSLLLLRQSYLQGALTADHASLILAGNLVNVGQAQEVYSFDGLSENIDFVIHTSNSTKQRFNFVYDLESAEEYSLNGTVAFEPSLNLFASSFNYLCAERIGARLLYPMPTNSQWEYHLGIQGEYTAFILANLKQSNKISNSTLLCAKTSDDTFAFQVTAWMREIIPNFDFNAVKLGGADQAQLRLGNRANLNELVRPSNIGFGLIYTLPIVVAALAAPAGSLLIIENPEAHLHPASQSAMGRFLARVAAAGVQVIIETHSDHILNGIRVAVKQQLLQADDVVLNFFSTQFNDENPQITQPKLYSDGGIDPWPTGFFDQFENDLLELLR